MTDLALEMIDAGLDALVTSSDRFDLGSDYRLGTVKGNSLVNPQALVLLDNDVNTTRCLKFTGPLWDGMRVLVVRISSMGWAVIGNVSQAPRLTKDSGVGIASIGTTSTTYTDTGTPLGTSFVVGATGAVLVHYYGRLQNNTTTNSGFISPECRDGGTVGAGNIIFAANDQDGMRQQPASITQLEKHGQTVLWDGLTPGATYNANVLIRSSNVGNSVSVNDRRVIVAPAP